MPFWYPRWLNLVSPRRRDHCSSSNMVLNWIHGQDQIHGILQAFHWTYMVVKILKNSQIIIMCHNLFIKTFTNFNVLWYFSVWIIPVLMTHSFINTVLGNVCSQKVLWASSPLQDILGNQWMQQQIHQFQRITT
jgi:hypothetical protein